MSWTQHGVSREKWICVIETFGEHCWCITCQHGLGQPGQHDEEGGGVGGVFCAWSQVANAGWLPWLGGALHLASPSSLSTCSFSASNQVKSWSFAFSGLLLHVDMGFYQINGSAWISGIRLYSWYSCLLWFWGYLHLVSRNLRKMISFRGYCQCWPKRGNGQKIFVTAKNKFSKYPRNAKTNSSPREMQKPAGQEFLGQFWVGWLAGLGFMRH